MISTNEFRKGIKLEHTGKPFVIVDFQFVNPGKGSAFVRTKLKNLETGQAIEITYKSGEKVPEPNLEYKEMQYLYFDGENYTFMDQESYDQVTLTKDELGDYKYFIIENLEFKDFMKDKDGKIKLYNTPEEAHDTCWIYEFPNAIV